MGSHVIASALYYLESMRQEPVCNQEVDRLIKIMGPVCNQDLIGIMGPVIKQGLDKLVEVMMHKLRGLRTFFLCSTIVRRNGHTSDCELPSSKILTHKLRVFRRLLLCSSLDTSQETLLVRVEAAVSKILDSRLSPVLSVRIEFHKYLVKMESFEEEISTWYTSLSDYLQISDSPVSISQKDSVLENLDDFLTFHRAYVGVIVDQIKALKDNITFLTNFISFATLLCPENQDIHDLLTLIQSLLISAAHLTVQLFSASHYNIEVFLVDVKTSTRTPSLDGMKSVVSDLLLRINPVDNPHLYETCSRALESLKSSR